MSEELIGKRLQNLISNCAFINADPDHKFSKMQKDEAIRIVNFALDETIKITDPKNIELFTKEVEQKRINKKMDDMRDQSRKELLEKNIECEMFQKDGTPKSNRNIRYTRSKIQEVDKN